MHSIVKYFERCNIFKLILVAVLSIVSLSIVINSIAYLFHIQLNNTSVENLRLSLNPLLFYFCIIFLFPLLETLFFQRFLINISSNLLRKLNVNSLIFPGILSALGFGLFHLYNLLYFFLGVIAGGSFAFFYVIVENRKESAFLVVFFIHAIINVISVILEYLQ